MADGFRLAARVMAMDDRTWRRHANPWSGYSRMAALPLIVLAVWSRVWIGWWSVVPVAGVVLWTWANPRIFPQPARLDRWMSRAVLGERIFLEHRAEIPAHHRVWASRLAGPPCRARR
ncbi:DUF6653 family protein [Anianabacter salinae]|uniref:DUF6653 family protein n=1 Tax=Anianabacter salinae TaxID=2851023 RepID=UPI00225DFC3A|nr:DUF6653 family protein [Anianabacter salinae]MBV0911423.1 hypothetical protein [Anianabacter salinae]